MKDKYTAEDIKKISQDYYISYYCVDEVVKIINYAYLDGYKEGYEMGYMSKPLKGTGEL